MTTRPFVLALAAFLPAGPSAPARTVVPSPLIDAAAPISDTLGALAARSEHPARHVLRSIAIDLDRDGDLDVVAATVEEPIVVWIRDDAGRFQRQTPPRAARMAAEPTVGGAPGDARALGEPPASRWHHVFEPDAGHLAAVLPAGAAPTDRASRALTRPDGANPSRGPPPRRLA